MSGLEVPPGLDLELSCNTGCNLLGIPWALAESRLRFCEHRLGEEKERKGVNLAGRIAVSVGLLLLVLSLSIVSLAANVP